MHLGQVGEGSVNNTMMFLPFVLASFHCWPQTFCYGSEDGERVSSRKCLKRFWGWGCWYCTFDAMPPVTIIKKNPSLPLVMGGSPGDINSGRLGERVRQGSCSVHVHTHTQLCLWVWHTWKEGLKIHWAVAFSVENGGQRCVWVCACVGGCEISKIWTYCSMFSLG